MKLNHILALIGLVAIAHWIGIFDRFGIDLSSLLPTAPTAIAPQTPEDGCPEYTPAFLFTMNEVGMQLPPQCQPQREGI